jgi:hypothetical protein
MFAEDFYAKLCQSWGISNHRFFVILNSFLEDGKQREKEIRVRKRKPASLVAALVFLHFRRWKLEGKASFFYVDIYRGFSSKRVNIAL